MILWLDYKPWTIALQIPLRNLARECYSLEATPMSRVLISRMYTTPDTVSLTTLLVVEIPDSINAPCHCVKRDHARRKDCVVH